MSRRRSTLVLAQVPALALAGALLAGCSGDDGGEVAADPAASTSAATPTASSSGTSEPSGPADGPDCAEVWVADETLPAGYQECYRDGERVKADGRYCEFGKPLITYDQRFWAVPGGRIGEVSGRLLQDAAYRDALRKCSG